MIKGAGATTTDAAAKTADAAATEAAASAQFSLYQSTLAGSLLFGSYKSRTN